jgi:hypothetical protein
MSKRRTAMWIFTKSALMVVGTISLLATIIAKKPSPPKPILSTNTLFMSNCLGKIGNWSATKKLSTIPNDSISDVGCVMSEICRHHTSQIRNILRGPLFDDLDHRLGRCEWFTLIFFEFLCNLKKISVNPSNLSNLWSKSLKNITIFRNKPEES